VILKAVFDFCAVLHYKRNQMQCFILRKSWKTAYTYLRVMLLLHFI